MPNKLEDSATERENHAKKRTKRQSSVPNAPRKVVSCASLPMIVLDIAVDFGGDVAVESEYIDLAISPQTSTIKSPFWSRGLETAF